MATDKSYAELKDDTAKILSKWAPLLERCGHLETLEEKLVFCNTLEKLSQKSREALGSDYILAPNQTLNVVNQTGTKRMVVSILPDGDFHFVRQHKDWIDD